MPGALYKKEGNTSVAKIRDYNSSFSQPFEPDFHKVLHVTSVVCKKYYIDTLVKELGINNINSNNPTYIPIDDSFEKNHKESQPVHHISGIGNV